MGAASSREEDASRAAAREHTKRCRERRRLMSEAGRLRRHLAASHAAYLSSLSVVASALTRFAVGEPIPVSDHTPPATIAHRPVVPPSSPPPLLREIERRRADAGEAPQQDDGVLDTRAKGGLGHEEVRLTVRHRSLAEVAAGLEEYFVKASVAGDTVSSLLETSGAEFKGRSHSFLGALCCLSAPSVDRLDSMNDRPRNRATLQQLLAWEKKLYKDVKARERLQIKHDKALAELGDQEYSRKIGVDIQKLKAAWERARAQLTTSNQSVHATASAVAELRDAHLARQVLELCHATLDMWRAMRQHHEAQAAVAQQLRGLSSRTSMDPTTEIHHEATRALESAMGVWHAATAHVARHQREYVHAVHGWLKLTLTPVAQEASSSPVAAELAAFVDRWGEVLDRVHCVEVMKSIRSVAGAARVLYGLQSDELKVARRVRHYSRELDRKSRMLRQVEKSYYDSYMLGGFSLWQRGREDVRQAREAQHEVAQRKDDITACRKTLEDEMRRHAKAIDATRSATVSSVQGKLPAVFQAVAAYSASHANALDAVCRPPQNAPTQ
jgi:hypothetical protein